MLVLCGVWQFYLFLKLCRQNVAIINRVSAGVSETSWRVDKL